MNTILKKFILSLVMILSVVTADCQRHSRHQTPYLSQDSIPRLSNSDIQLVNLNYNAMIYWHNTANKLDTLYRIEKEKVKLYGEITGIQAASINDFRQLYANKQALEKAMEYQRAEDEKRLKKDMRLLKIKNLGLSVAVVGLTITTIYFAAN